MYPILDTRVECKLALDEISTPCAVDRIEPDWNVNSNDGYRTRP